MSTMYPLCIHYVCNQHRNSGLPSLVWTHGHVHYVSTMYAINIGTRGCLVWSGHMDMSTMYPLCIHYVCNQHRNSGLPSLVWTHGHVHYVSTMYAINTGTRGCLVWSGHMDMSTMYPLCIHYVCNQHRNSGLPSLVWTHGHVHYVSTMYGINTGTRGCLVWSGHKDMSIMYPLCIHYVCNQHRNSGLLRAVQPIALYGHSLDTIPGADEI